MPKTVQLSDDAYATLAALKAPGESFSETVLRLVGERKDPTLLLKLGGLRPDYDYRELRTRSNQIEERRMKARLERRG
jgi:predicted CopG family antitoxin